jgi:cytochrome c biogenesis protein CcmG, thiol:disulfide interchange protein DsbE
VNARPGCRVASWTLLLGVFIGGCTPAQPSEPAATGAVDDRYGEPVPTASFLDPCETTGDARPAPGGLPSMALRCLGPGPVDPAALRGRPTVVNLWATWCLPCQREMPALQRVHERLGDQVRFVGVDTRDDDAGAVAFLRAVGVTYSQAVDPDGDLLRRLRIPGLPVTVLLDREGRVAYRKVGPITESGLTAQIRAVM